MPTNDLRPFIDDTRALGHYSGHRYVVLRVGGDPALRYRQIQSQLRTRLHDPAIMYPAEPHVTLAGYKPGTDAAHLGVVVAEWATTVGPLEIQVGEPVSWFPSPFQIVVLPVLRTQALFDALVGIRDAGARAGFPLATVMPPESWRFHLTLATCTGLDSEAWAETQRIAAARETGPAARDTNFFLITSVLYVPPRLPSGHLATRDGRSGIQSLPAFPTADV